MGAYQSFAVFLAWAAAVAGAAFVAAVLIHCAPLKPLLVLRLLDAVSVLVITFDFPFPSSVAAALI